MRTVVLGLTAFSLLACGPSVDSADATTDDWMLGTLSTTKSLGAGGIAERFELLDDGEGSVTFVDCDEQAVPLSWEQADESVVLEYDVSDELSIRVQLDRPECDDDGLIVFPGQVTRMRPSLEDSVQELEFYRSAVCPGERTPGEECGDGSNECDPAGMCEHVWCEGAEPEPCGD